MVIQPYWHEEAWVFDDEYLGFEHEPLEGDGGELGELIRLSGPSLIDRLVRDIPDAHDGFTLLFSSQPFSGCQIELTGEREEDGGCTYKVKDSRVHHWVPPALLHYFGTAPQSLYIRAEPRRDRYDPVEVVALKDRIEELERLVGKLTLDNDLLRNRSEAP